MCVPVISLKVLSFVSMGGESLSRIRLHSLSFAVGVVVTYFTNCICYYLIKAVWKCSGMGLSASVSSNEVSILALIMSTYWPCSSNGCKYWNFLTRLGSKADKNPNYMNSFSTGVLAVIVASPCTAPFMGAAIGYAILQPAIITLPGFPITCVRLCIPISTFNCQTRLNIINASKPGKWMETLKRVFLHFQCLQHLSGFYGFLVYR